MKLKITFYLLIFFAFTVFTINNAFGQSSRAAEVKNATWQTSAPEIVNEENPSLGIRDKWGGMETYDALFVVSAPNKKVFKAKARGSGDFFTYVDFPKDFSGKPNLRGVYKVAFYVNGVLIARNKFRFQP